MNMNDFTHKALLIDYDFNEYEINHCLIYSKENNFNKYLKESSTYQCMRKFKNGLIINKSLIQSIIGIEKIFINVKGNNKYNYDLFLDEISYNEVFNDTKKAIFRAIEEIVNPEEKPNGILWDYNYTNDKNLDKQKGESIKIKHLIPDELIQLIDLNTNVNFENVEIEKWL